MSQVKVERSKQACDSCRAKKRKCDGGIPCANCQKAPGGKKSKGRERIECCYSQPILKGFKGISKAVLSRLEVIETILRKKHAPAGTDVKLVEDRLMKLLETSDEFFDVKSDFSYCDMQYYTQDQNQFQNTESVHQYQNSFLNYSNLEVEMGLEKQRSRGARLDVSSINGFSKYEIDQHLLSICDLSFCGYSVDEDLNFVNPAYRGRPLSEKLHKAMCFSSVFASTHPGIFKGKTNIKIEDRLEAAKAYDPLNHISILSPVESSLQERCDDIRALLLNAVTLSALGKLEEGMNILAVGLLKAKNSGLFQRHSIIGPPTPNIVTCEDLLSKCRQPQINLDSMTVLERSELVAFLSYVVTVDTYAVATQGLEFIVDSNMVPRIVNDDFLTQTPGHFDPRRKLIPTLAKYTIWEKSTMAPMVDEALEMKYVLKSIPAYAKYRSSGVLENMRLFRRIIEFSRRNRYGIILEDVIMNASFLHRRVLEELALIPLGILPFPHLEVFAPGMPPFENTKQIMLPDLYATLVALLGMLSYLHLPLIEAGVKPKFPLSISGPSCYSSEEIFYTLTNAFQTIIHVTSQPMNLNDSIFEPFQYSESELYEVLHNKKDLPSPVLFCSSHIMLGYTVSSSSMVALRTPKNRELLRDVQKMVKNTIIPGIARMGRVWPVAQIFAMQLEERLNESGFSADGSMSSSE
jgi:hypothetical protein